MKCVIAMIYPTVFIGEPVGRMHSSPKVESPPLSEGLLCSCDKVYIKWEECFLLFLICPIVTWQYIPKPLDYNWPCTVINDHDWQLTYRQPVCRIIWYDVFPNKRWNITLSNYTQCHLGKSEDWIFCIYILGTANWRFDQVWKNIAFIT